MFEVPYLSNPSALRLGTNAVSFASDHRFIELFSNTERYQQHANLYLCVDVDLGL